MAVGVVSFLSPAKCVICCSQKVLKKRGPPKALAPALKNLLSECFLWAGGNEIRMALSFSGDAVTPNCPSVERELWPRKQSGSYKHQFRTANNVY